LRLSPTVAEKLRRRLPARSDYGRPALATELLPLEKLRATSLTTLIHKAMRVMSDKKKPSPLYSLITYRFN
jgi:hypothetical protein